MSDVSEARVLVVDDQDSITDLVATALRYVGFEVAVAANGRQALERAAKFRPELVVLDVMLPDLDGFEVCRRMREEGTQSPVLFLTASGRHRASPTYPGPQRRAVRWTQRFVLRPPAMGRYGEPSCLRGPSWEGDPNRRPS